MNARCLTVLLKYGFILSVIGVSSLDAQSWVKAYLDKCSPATDPFGCPVLDEYGDPFVAVRGN